MEASTQLIVRGVEIVALLVISLGTIEALVNTLRAVFRNPNNDHALRSAWIRYSRWLVAGLTFQLGADIVQTSIAPGWDEIGRLGAIAAIRTFLSFFLERDQREMRELQRNE